MNIHLTNAFARQLARVLRFVAPKKATKPIFYQSQWWTGAGDGRLRILVADPGATAVYASAQLCLRSKSYLYLLMSVRTRSDEPLNGG